MKYLSSMIIFFILLILHSCTPKQQELTLNIENYRNWKRVTPQVLDYEVPGHGATARIIYANNTTLDLRKQTKTDNGYLVADGSIIVKEVYKQKSDVGQKQPVLTIMKKDSSHPHARDGWLYLVKAPGKKLELIKGRFCAGCHVAANESHLYFDKNRENKFRDYLFYPFFKGE